MANIVVTPANPASVVLTQVQLLRLLDTQKDALNSLSERRAAQIEAWKADEEGRLKDYIELVSDDIANRAEREFNAERSWISYIKNWKPNFFQKLIGKRAPPMPMVIHETALSFGCAELNIFKAVDLIRYALNDFKHWGEPVKAVTMWERLIECDKHFYGSLIYNQFTSRIERLETRTDSVMRSEGVFILSLDDYNNINADIDTAERELPEPERKTYRSSYHDLWDC